MDVRGRIPNDRPAAVVIIGDGDDKVSVVATVNEAGRAKGLSANALLQVVGPVVGGRGGGKDDLAQGGGTEVAKIDEALALVAPAVAKA
jgi:alanyl-tRNA synthetase